MATWRLHGFHVPPPQGGRNKSRRPKLGTFTRPLTPASGLSQGVARPRARLCRPDKLRLLIEAAASGCEADRAKIPSTRADLSPSAQSRASASPPVCARSTFAIGSYLSALAMPTAVEHDVAGSVLAEGESVVLPGDQRPKFLRNAIDHRIGALHSGIETLQRLRYGGYSQVSRHPPRQGLGK